MPSGASSPGAGDEETGWWWPRRSSGASSSSPTLIAGSTTNVFEMVSDLFLRRSVDTTPTSDQLTELFPASVSVEEIVKLPLPKMDSDRDRFVHDVFRCGLERSNDQLCQHALSLWRSLMDANPMVTRALCASRDALEWGRFVLKRGDVKGAAHVAEWLPIAHHWLTPFLEKRLFAAYSAEQSELALHLQEDLHDAREEAIATLIQHCRQESQ